MKKNYFPKRQSKKRETQPFPAILGVWSNLVTQKQSQVHATHVNIQLYLWLLIVKSPNFRISKEINQNAFSKCRINSPSTKKSPVN